MASSTVDIRLAGPEHAGVVFQILAESFLEYRSQYTAEAFQVTVLSPPKVRERMREGPVWVGTLGARFVATVSAVVTDGGVYVRGMAVVPDARGHRLGWRMLEAVEQFAGEQRAAGLYLSSTPFLGRASALYERFGFCPSDEGPDNLFGTRLFTMAKIL